MCNAISLNSKNFNNDILMPRPLRPVKSMSISISNFNVVTTQKVLVGGRRLYQYNEDNFRFTFLFISSFLTAWIHINMESIRSCRLKKFIFDYLYTCISKKLVSLYNYWKLFTCFRCEVYVVYMWIFKQWRIRLPLR